MGEVHDIAAGFAHSVALAENPALQYPVNPAQDMLLICNTNLESVFVKDYYLAHRPLVSQANVLTIGYAPQETILPADFETAMRTPVLNWLAANPTKKPKYWVLFLGVPSRIHADTNEYGYYGGTHPSVSVTLSALPGARNPFITHINMGNTNHIGDTNACRAYIDKLEFFGTNYSPRKIVISASAGGYGNTNYYFDGVGGFTFAAYEAGAGVVAAGISTNNVYVRAVEPHINRGTNVAAYYSSGIHGWQSFQSTVNGDVVFEGNSQWYVMLTYESFNGYRFAEIPPLFQGNFIKWFSSSAFGGTNFSNTPVGAVTHTDEPGPGDNINDRQIFYGYWASGKTFCLAAWNSRRTPFFQAVGDPLVKK